MTSSRGGFIVGLLAGGAVTAAVLAGCGKAPSPSPAHPTGSGTTTTTAAATSTTSSIVQRDPQRAFDDAVRAMKAQDWSSYEWGTQAQAVSGTYSTTRQVDVDLVRGLARVDITSGVMGEPKRTVVQMVVSKDASFLTVPASSGARGSQWAEATSAAFRRLALPDHSRLEPTALPAGLGKFRADSMEHNVLEGSVDGAAGLALLGLQDVLVDGEVRRTVTGRLPVVVTLDLATGRIAYVEAIGGRSTISASSSSFTKAQISQWVRASATGVTFRDSEPEAITIPRADEIATS